jgi:hypothetical protein
VRLLKSLAVGDKAPFWMTKFRDKITAPAGPLTGLVIVYHSLGVRYNGRSTSVAVLSSSYLSLGKKSLV